MPQTSEPTGRVGLRYLSSQGRILGVNWMDAVHGDLVIDADPQLLNHPDIGWVHVVTQNVRYPVHVTVSDPRTGWQGPVRELDIRGGAPAGSSA